MNKMPIYFCMAALLVAFVTSCNPLESASLNFPEGDSGMPDFGKPKTAILPAGAKFVFAPTIDAGFTKAMVADRENSGEQYHLNKANDTQEQTELLVPNVIYTSFDDGSFQEVLFESTNGQKLRVEVENLANAGEGYISAQLTNIYPMIEVDDGNG